MWFGFGICVIVLVGRLFGFVVCLLFVCWFDCLVDTNLRVFITLLLGLFVGLLGVLFFCWLLGWVWFGWVLLLFGVFVVFWLVVCFVLIGLLWFGGLFFDCLCGLF